MAASRPGDMPGLDPGETTGDLRGLDQQHLPGDEPVDSAEELLCPLLSVGYGCRCCGRRHRSADDGLRPVSDMPPAGRRISMGDELLRKFYLSITFKQFVAASKCSPNGIEMIGHVRKLGRRRTTPGNEKTCLILRYQKRDTSKRSVVFLFLIISEAPEVREDASDLTALRGL